MARSNPKEIEEVFVIQTEAIGFFGALAKEICTKTNKNNYLTTQLL